MRKIKFRGRCAGAWRKGDHLTYAKGDVIKAWMGSISPEYDVEPDTVGQFTGKYDGDSNEIYEGDIIEFSGYNHRMLVCWDNRDGKFLLTSLKNKLFALEMYSIDNFAVKVIGNIYDNPELLKGK